MTRPRRFLLRMIIFLVIVAAAVGLLFIPLRDAFFANPAMNGMILGGLFVGIIYIFRQVASLGPEVRWIEAYRAGGPVCRFRIRPPFSGPSRPCLANAGSGASACRRCL